MVGISGVGVTARLRGVMNESQSPEPPDPGGGGPGAALENHQVGGGKKRWAKEVAVEVTSKRRRKDRGREEVRNHTYTYAEARVNEEGRR